MVRIGIYDGPIRRAVARLDRDAVVYCGARRFDREPAQVALGADADAAIILHVYLYKVRQDD